jgi:hypothetical protein
MKKNAIGAVALAGILATVGFLSMVGDVSRATDPTPTPTPAPEVSLPLTVTFDDSFTSVTLTAIAAHQGEVARLTGVIQAARAERAEHEAALESLERALSFRDDVATGFGYAILLEGE